MYLDAIIIGAGFSGLYQLHKCRDQLGLKTLVIEEGKELGGLGIGTNIQVRDVILKAIFIAILFLKKFTKIGNGKKDTLNKKKF